MTQEKQVFLDVLKSFIWGTELKPIPDSMDWKELIRLANIHFDIGILSYVLLKNPTVAPTMLPMMKKYCFQTISIFTQKAMKMKELIKKLDEAGIDHLLFKGFVIRNIYPEPELRTFGDIDFLIRKEDRKHCDELMVGLGLERKHDWEPVYSYVRGMEYYEVHTDVMEVDVSDKADYKGYFQKVWEHAYLEKGHTWLLDTEYHLLYLLTHIAKHISGSGAGIRMYMDIAFYVKKYRHEIDWAHFCQELKILKFESFANIVFTAIEQWFGVDSPIELKPVDQRVMDDFLDFTLDGGVFGKVGRDSGVTSLKKENSNDLKAVNRGKALIHRFGTMSSLGTS